MRERSGISALLSGFLALGLGASARGQSPDPQAVERGRKSLTEKSYTPPAWSDGAYTKARKFLGPDAPDPERDSGGYAAAFRRRYGLHPAPFPNDGLPMGLRRADRPDGTRSGLLTDCLLCHGGSIGGTSYVGLGNSTLDLHSFLAEMTRADDRMAPPLTFVLNTTRGTNNAPQIAAFLLSLRNADLSFRRFPMFLGARFSEVDVPAWWLLKKKRTIYYDGRTDARSHRSLMQFFLGDFTLQQFKDLEPAFKDVLAYLKSLEAPQYPFPIDRARADRGADVFATNCAKCHGTYGPGGEYPNKIIELKVIGTDPVRAVNGGERAVEFFNSTWFAEEYPIDEEMIGYQAPPLDGIWATAPYLHNGSVPTLHALLNSKERPKRFRRPPSTDFDHYDTVHVGWKFETVDAPPPPDMPVQRARYFFDASRYGLSNVGHTFGDRLSEDDRMDLLEYLKTL